MNKFNILGSFSILLIVVMAINGIVFSGVCTMEANCITVNTDVCETDGCDEEEPCQTRSSCSGMTYCLSSDVSRTSVEVCQGNPGTPAGCDHEPFIQCVDTVKKDSEPCYTVWIDNTIPVCTSNCVCNVPIAGSCCGLYCLMDPCQG